MRQIRLHLFGLFARGNIVTAPISLIGCPFWLRITVARSDTLKYVPWIPIGTLVKTVCLSQCSQVHPGRCRSSGCTRSRYSLRVRAMIVLFARERSNRTQ